MSQVVTAGQSLVDVAIQELGSVEALFELADAAGLAITDTLAAGQVLDVPSSPAAVLAVATYFSGRRQRINTGELPAPMPAGPHDFDSQDFDHQDFDTN